MDNIEQQLQELKQSPLFNLSLSSKELFHSNFIAWICEIYPNEFGEIIANYFNLQETSITSIKREQKNLDIIINFQSSQIIIENKVKSIPNKQQLIDYKSKTDSNSILVLLAIIQPSFNLDEIGWKLMSYQQLSALLTKLSERITNQYHQLIIKDYIKFIYILTDLISSIKLNIENDHFNFHGNTYQQFKRVKLHDLYLKYTYNELAKGIQHSLKSKMDNIDILVKDKYTYENKSDQIVISTNLVKGKGVINIDYSNVDDMIYGIMLDGQRYLQYIHVWEDKEKNIYEIANNLQKDNKWFKFEDVAENEIYPQKGKAYNKFGKKMIYRSIKIKNDQSILSILNNIYNDINKLL